MKVSDEQNDWFVDESIVKARLAWLKQELEIRQQQENKIRHDYNNALLDSDADRKYFAAELAKREVIIDDLAREKHSKESIDRTKTRNFILIDHLDFERQASDKMKLLQVDQPIEWNSFELFEWF